MLSVPGMILQATPQVAPVSIDYTFGAAYIGVVVGAALYGVSVLQTYNYYISQKDGWFVQALVGAVFAFETTHQLLISHTVYIYTITHYNDPAFQANVVWSLLVEVLFNGFTAFLVQGFLARRIWHLSNKDMVLILPVAALIFSEFGCVLAFGIISLARVTTFEELATLKALSIAVNALAAAGDVLIAVILCSILHRSRTGFRKSDTIITKLTMYAINTGLLTSLCAIASLISIVVRPDTFLYITFFFCIGRFYANSLLATLNARDKIRSAADVQINSTSQVSFSLKDTFSRLARVEKGNAKPQTNLAVRVDTTRETDAKLDIEGANKYSSTVSVTGNDDESNYGYAMKDLRGNAHSAM